MIYVRYEAARPNHRGHHPGVFALANGLARSGSLTPADWTWWRTSNDWFNAAYPDPGTVNPALFDRSRHRVVACWFKASAQNLLSRVSGCLDLLDRYGVAWAERRCVDPGRVLYEDSVQVVVIPPDVN